jgi:hypothetical protein
MPSVAQHVNYNETVVFTVFPNGGYRIYSVTGCGGTLNDNIYTTATVTSDCAVNAIFVAILPVRMNGNDYLTLQDAYSLSDSGFTIQSWATTMVGDLTIDKKDVYVNLKGGYDANYMNQYGYTILKGKLIIGQGGIVVDRLAIE